jgi:SAM-dependent methyltransferase
MADPKVMRHWKATQSHWDDDAFLAETANAFMKRRWRRLNRRCAAFFGAEAARLGRGLDLVDLGCAHADFEAWARPFLASYTGIEPSKALLPKNRSEGRAFRLLRGQAEKLPLPKACADAVLIKEVLDHCWGPEKVLAEASRVLRPGGVVLITLTNDHAWYKRLMPAWAARIKASQDDHINFFHPDWVARLLMEAGFEALGADDSHYLRLPYRVESLLGRLPEAVTDAVMGATDAAGSLALPGLGGSFWVWARKPAVAPKPPVRPRRRRA